LAGIQQLLIICAVLASFVVALWTLRRRGLVRFASLKFGGRPERKLQVLERLQLTPHHSLCLVRMEERTLLIGTAPSSCHVLDQTPRPAGGAL
jgi:flagellar biogenesis protein FliO